MITIATKPSCKKDAKSDEKNPAISRVYYIHKFGEKKHTESI
jgi:hypothetical protein